MDDQYYLQEDGEQTGPYTFDELIERAPDIHTRVLSTNENSWKDACDLPELYEYFREQGVIFPTEDNLASFGLRLAAFIIDLILINIIADIIVVAMASRGVFFNMQSFTSMQALSKIPANQMIGLEIAFNVVFLLYNTICEASGAKATFGKRAFGMIVVNADGEGMTVPASIVRSFGKVVSFFFWGLGFLPVLWTEHRQGLPDFLAKTYVIRKNA